MGWQRWVAESANGPFPEDRRSMDGVRNPRRRISTFLGRQVRRLSRSRLSQSRTLALISGAQGLSSVALDRDVTGLTESHSLPRSRVK